MFQPPDANSGINDHERKVLTTHYYLRPEISVPAYIPGQLDAIQRRSIDPTLDGEWSERQTSDLTTALAASGDEAFAKVLAEQRVMVKQAVANRLLGFLANHGLRYPRTSAVLRSFYEAELRQPRA